MKRYISRGDKATRAGFGEALLEVGMQDERVVALCADLTESLQMKKFEKTFPHRFFNAGIAEANMISIGCRAGAQWQNPFCRHVCQFCRRPQL
jgi:transketolase